MNSHPAYRTSTRQQTIKGIIKSIFFESSSINIFRVETGEDVLQCHTSFGLLTPSPCIGDIWIFNGTDEYSDEYGSFMNVQSGGLEFPDSALLINFLSHHVPGLSRVKAQELQKLYKNSLISLIDANNIYALTKAGKNNIPIQIAESVVTVWRHYIAMTKLRLVLRTINLTSDVFEEILSTYGDLASQKILEDPYRLINFSSYAVVDEWCQRHLKLSDDDPRRLAGAALSSIHSLSDQSRRYVHINDLLMDIPRKSKIGSNLLHSCLIHAFAKRLLVRLDKHYVQSAGAAIIDRFIVFKLSALLKRPSCSRSLPSINLLMGMPESGKDCLEFISKSSLALITGPINHNALTTILALRRKMTKENQLVAVVSQKHFLANQIAEMSDEPAYCIHDFLSNKDGIDKSLFTTLIVVSSALNHTTLANLLKYSPHLHKLFIFADAERSSLESDSLLNELLSIKAIPHYDLNGTHPLCSSGLTAHRQVVQQGHTMPRLPYSARDSSARGLFSVDISEANAFQVAIGIQHQLSRHGPTAILYHSSDKEAFKKYLNLSYRGKQHFSMSLDDATNVAYQISETEFGEFDSVIVLLPECANFNQRWLCAAIATGRSKAVLVGNAKQLQSKGEQSSIHQDFSSLEYHWNLFLGIDS